MTDEQIPPDTEEELLKSMKILMDLCQKQRSALEETLNWFGNDRLIAFPGQQIADALNTAPPSVMPAPAQPTPDPFNRKQVEAVCRAVCKVEGVDPDDDTFGDGCDPVWTRYADAVADALAAQPPAAPVETGLSDALASIPPDLSWLIGKGKTRPDEPPFGVQLLRGLKVIAETEGDDLCEVIKAAIAEIPE